MPSFSMTLMTIDVVRTVGLVAAVGCTAALVLWMERSRLRAAREIADRTQQSLLGIREMAAEIVALRDRLEEISADGLLRETPAAPACAAPAPPAVQPFVAAVPARSHDLAIRLARQGVGADEIMSATGLTRSEAALVVRIHSGAHQRGAMESQSAA